MLDGRGAGWEDPPVGDGLFVTRGARAPGFGLGFGPVGPGGRGIPRPGFDERDDAAGLTPGFAAADAAGLAPGFAAGLAPGFAAAGAAGLALDFTAGLAPGFVTGLASGFAVGLAPGLAAGLAPGFVAGLAAALVVGVCADASASAPTFFPSQTFFIFLTTGGSIAEEAVLINLP